MMCLRLCASSCNSARSFSISFHDPVSRLHQTMPKAMRCRKQKESRHLEKHVAASCVVIRQRQQEEELSLVDIRDANHVHLMLLPGLGLQHLCLLDRPVRFVSLGQHPLDFSAGLS